MISLPDVFVCVLKEFSLTYNYKMKYADLTVLWRRLDFCYACDKVIEGRFVEDVAHTTRILRTW